MPPWAPARTPWRASSTSTAARSASGINDELPAANGEVPSPDWSAFEEQDLVDLDDELRERFRRIAKEPAPAPITKDKRTPSVRGDDDLDVGLRKTAQHTT